MASRDLIGQTPSDAVCRVASALGHPRRIRILLALAAGPGSATSLAKSIGDDLTRKDVEYHVQVLVEGGVVALAGSRRIRGATERLYELPPGLSGNALCEQIPEAILLGLQHAWTGRGELTNPSDASERDKVSGSLFKDRSG